MTQIRYFAECGGQPVRLTNVHHTGQFSRAKGFSGTCPACGQIHPAGRKIEYKANPSKHKCDARCEHATGKIMRCECSCGGKYHGRGSAPAVI